MGRWGLIAMDCVGCGSAAVTERPDRTAQGYRRFRCRDCGKQFNERSDGVLNRASLPSDIIAFVVFCRLRYRLTLRELVTGATLECTLYGSGTPVVLLANAGCSSGYFDDLARVLAAGGLQHARDWREPRLARRHNCARLGRRCGWGP